MIFPSGRNHRPSGLAIVRLRAPPGCWRSGALSFLPAMPKPPAGMPGCRFAGALPIQPQSHPIAPWRFSNTATHSRRTGDAFTAFNFAAHGNFNYCRLHDVSWFKHRFPRAIGRWEAWGFARTPFWVHHRPIGSATGGGVPSRCHPPRSPHRWLDAAGALDWAEAHAGAYPGTHPRDGAVGTPPPRQAPRPSIRLRKKLHVISDHRHQKTARQWSGRHGYTTPLTLGGGAHCSPRSARRRGSPPRPVSPGRLAWSAPDSTRCRVDTLPHGHTTTRILCRTDTPRRHVRSSGSTDSGRSRYTPPPMGKGPRETTPHTGTCRSSRAPLPALLCRGEPPDHFFRRGSGWPWKHFPGRKTRARTVVQNHRRSKPPSFKYTAGQVNHRSNTGRSNTRPSGHTAVWAHHCPDPGLWRHHHPLGEKDTGYLSVIRWSSSFPAPGADG